MDEIIDSGNDINSLEINECVVEEELGDIKKTQITEQNEVNSEEMQTNKQQEAVSTIVNGKSEIDPSKEYPCAPAPPVDIKLFLGRISRFMTEDEVRPLFSVYGDVLEVNIIRDRNTNAHKSSAFVRMACIAEADAAIREMSGKKIVDPNLGAVVVKYAAGEAERLGITPNSSEPGVDPAKLFVGSLPKAITDEEVKQIFEPYGTVEEVYVMRDSSGVCKGCAFVKFAYKEQGIYARKELDGKRSLEGLTRPMEVRFAEGKGAKNDTAGIRGAGGRNMRGFGMDEMGGGGFYPNAFGSGMGVNPGSNNAPRSAGPWKEYFNTEGRAYYHNEITNVTQWDKPSDFEQTARRSTSNIGETITGPPGSNIFVFHVPNEWSDSHLYGHFAPYGPILSATIAKDGTMRRNRGFGFVSYANPQAAAHAVEAMNGFMVFGKRLKVQFKQGERDAAVAMLIKSRAGAFNGMRRMGCMGGMGPMFNPVCGMQPNMMSPYGMMQGNYGRGGGYAGNRYTPY